MLLQLRARTVSWGLIARVCCWWAGRQGGANSFTFKELNSISTLETAQADKEALAHIVYNLDGEHGEVDAQMIEALRPSIEEAEPIETMEMALDYIGKRGAQVRPHPHRAGVL